ncbi:MAG: DNA-binding transcriptional regulator [Pirellulales bacterium]|nr:DNA-binding transcriptional regulator [Pirellulales bacterium]
MRKRPKVALLIESSRAYGRGLLRGIAAYLRTHRPWSIYVELHGLEQPPPEWIGAWDGDGILARVTDRHMLKLLRGTGVPTIDLRGALVDTGLPLVGLDSAAAARLAFEHFRERGFRNLAFCGVQPGTYRFLDQRGAEFERLASDAGCRFERFPGNDEAQSATTWDEEQRHMVSWLTRLPKPVGILACHDDRGHELLNACREAELAVPDDVAVIGVDNDEVLCDLSDPPLSSIDSNTAQVGYRAAALLDAMMAGEADVTGTVLVKPAGVVLRRSTDALAIDDRELAAAMRFIREHACDGINVDDVLQKVRLSRATLDRRFSKVFGHSPSDEIMRLRIERVKQLLVETTYPLPRVANLAGFEHSEHMGALFRRKTGQTPGEYRNACRAANGFAAPSDEG